MKKSNFKRLIAILLAMAPLAFAAACSQPDNSATGGDPSDIVEEEPGEENPSEETPSEEEPGEGTPSEEEPGEGTPSEENPSEEEPGEETPSEEEPGEENPPEETPTKPSLPGGLVDGGNFTGNV